ncbi:L-ribulose-5-phosphate 4-epimerase [soil metagenome]
MSYQTLKSKVYEANLALVEAGLVVLTWGNASAIDRDAGVMAIKPSGLPYKKMLAEDIVILSIETGKVIDGTARPSSDTPTHLHLYREFETCGGIVHTHSLHGTSFAQAMREIPCLGTTHADNFYGAIPVTRLMSDEEIAAEYELNTGRVIVERFRSSGIDPAYIPGVLVAGHAPFAWGESAEKAVENAVVLEFSARMALNTYLISETAEPIAKTLLDKHYLRKHGAEAYYGQIKK